MSLPLPLCSWKLGWTTQFPKIDLAIKKQTDPFTVLVPVNKGTQYHWYTSTIKTRKMHTGPTKIDTHNTLQMNPVAYQRPWNRRTITNKVV